MDFRKRLHDLRADKDMGQTDLGALLNLKNSAISKYEQGTTQPSITTLIKMAEIFECSVDYLLGLSDRKNPYTTSNFTPKETEIIARYRRLSKDNQIRIDERISTMLDLQRRTNNK